MDGQTLGQQQAQYGITPQNPYGLAASSPYANTQTNNLTNNRGMRDNLQTQGADFSGYQNQLNSLLQDPSSFQRTPGYQFAVDQGQQAIERSAAKRGMLNSGNVLAELSKYGQGMANQEYGNQVNTLAGLMGGAQKFGTATNYFQQPTYGQPVQSSNTSWNMAYGNQNPTSNW